MASGFQSIRDFFREAWRRRVLQVAIPYGVGAWLLVQVAEVILDAFEAPAWVMQGMLTILLIGFPIAVVLAWVFDYTPKGGLVMTPSRGGAEAAAEPEPEPLPVPAMSIELGASERRQVTILHCAFAPGNDDDPDTDPEHTRDAISAIKEFSTGLSDRYHAIQLPSNAEELILLFGYPQAKGDDAQRAVAAGFAVIERLQRPSSGGASQDHVALNARIGVSTGLVVVDEADAEGGTVSVVGQAPRLSAWLMGQASPNTILIGPQTNILVRKKFRTDPMQVHPTSPFGDEFATFRIFPDKPDAIHRPSGLSPETHEEELQRLRDDWQHVEEGGGKFVVISGEAGIGKSTLLWAFEHEAVSQGTGRLFQCQCSPYEQTQPLHPLIELLQDKVLSFESREAESSKLQKLKASLQEWSHDSAEAYALMARLLRLDSAPDFPRLDLSPQSQRDQTLELLADLLTTMAERMPVIMVIEDLHWADPTTRELVQKIIDRGPAPGLLLLLSTRPGQREDWMQRSYVSVHELRPLSPKRARLLLSQIEGADELPESLIKRIVSETDGNPLYLQELTRAILESGEWRKARVGENAEDHSWLVIPATLQDSLAARIDNLGEAKALLQLCSVMGREFSYDLLLAVTATENEKALKKQLSRIVNAELLFARGARSKRTFTFKHILIQETAYQSLLKSKRRELHGRIAQVLEEQFPETAQQQPFMLAEHFSSAGEPAKAIRYGTLACKSALDNAANQEAIEQATRAIGWVHSLPESTARSSMEIPLQSVLGGALLATHGYTHGEVQKAFSRALALCEDVGDAPQLFRVVVGLWMYHFIGGHLDEALVLSQRMLRIAEATHDPAQNVQARYCLGFIHVLRADFMSALSHLNTAVELEDPEVNFAAQSASGDDTRSHVRVLLALVRWLQGEPGEALTRLQQGIEIARAENHPFGEVFVTFYGAWINQLLGDVPETLRYSEEAMGIAQENGFRFFVPLIGFMKAWADNQNGGAKGGDSATDPLADMQNCYDLYRGSGCGFGLGYMCSALASEYVAGGNFDAASKLIEDGLEAKAIRGDAFFEPEFERLLGRIDLARLADDDKMLMQAEKHFRESIRIAQHHGSKALELRTTLDLAELMERTGRRDEATRLLDGILGRFDDGDPGADLDRASKLLTSLHG